MNAYEKEYTEEDFAEYLDEIYEPIEFAGMTIHASDMRTIDPIMFRCGIAEMPIVWCCEECDTEYEEEDDANECCQPECPHCGTGYQDLNSAQLCCIDEDEEEED
jgi:hypothetical protein